MEEKHDISDPSIDEILNRLSTKFNRIFYDREFVCCVHEDFQVILKNKDKCCVVVFPVLGPSYLKAVRYQAKIFDLAVFVLGTGTTRFIAVCQKEFLKKKDSEVTEDTPKQIMPEGASEGSCINTKKKRPERQLYVPPAQRRLPSRDELTKKCHSSKRRSINKKTDNDSFRNKNILSEEFEIDKSKIHDILHNDKTTKESKNEETKYIYYPPKIGSICILWDYRISKHAFNSKLQYFYEYINYLYFKYYHYFSFYYKLPLYTCESSSNIYILNKYYVLWQPKLDIIFHKSDSINANSRTYPLFNFEESPLMPSDSIHETNLPLIKSYTFDVLQTYDYSDFRTFKVQWDKSQCGFSECDIVIDLSFIGSRHNFVINKNGTYYFYECQQNHDILKCYLNFKEQDGNDSCQLANKPAEQNKVASIKSSANILKEQGTETSVQLNNIKNTIPNSSITVHDVIEKKVDHDKNSHDPKKSSEHEQEKEIMRIAKKNINRKTRPIIKYVDDSNNTLNIGKNDNVNNWEDLFDDNGHIQEELFKEITHKVGPDVTIVKAKEDYTDYSEYITKQSEELEHMVELYDFPSTLGTQDIIQAFSDIRSDAMYIKWVDDTHAILVLGSLSQAQRAIELDNPLIKVRPMKVASGMTLATAYKHDLKPAMKRPQTNLQTARRLITTHLGTKSQISREQTAKERDDLKAAKELKRLVRKNEQDAWEGNLRSSAS